MKEEVESTLEEFKEKKKCPKCKEEMYLFAEYRGGNLIVYSKDPNKTYSVPYLMSIWKCKKCKKKYRNTWIPRLEIEE